MSIKYQNPRFNPDELSVHNIDKMAVSAVDNNSEVLDIGCATGFMGKYLQQVKHCNVFGVDLRSAEIEIAKQNLNFAMVGNIEDTRIVTSILSNHENKKFDCVLATSLIEHVSDPDKVIMNMKRLLKPNGKIILSTPNISHWAVIVSLLKGDFTYTDYGILDRTHLHFFTIKTFRELFVNNNVQIEKLLVDAEGGGFPRLSLALVHFFPNLFVYQILIIGRMK